MRSARRILAFLLLAATGCGPSQFPVTGKVTFPDGSPLEEGIVICETTDGEKPVMARGTLKKDGTFRLGTTEPGNGAPVGKYRVLVVPRALNEYERNVRLPFIDSKYERFESSGLTLEVVNGPRELLITVTKPQDKAR